jgi:formate hydrogenlyase subunit 4
MQDGQLFTWVALLTIGGASLLTFYIVQYTKLLLDRYWQLPTDVYAVAVAWLVLMVAQIATGTPWLDWRMWFLSLANAFIVAAAAGQIQNKSVNPPGGGKEQDNGKGI